MSPTSSSPPVKPPPRKGLLGHWDKLTDRLPLSPVVTVVRLEGSIGAPLGAGRRSLSLTSLESVLDRAFAPRRLLAVAVVVNSPGGAPVQSALIFQRLRDLAAERKVPILTFVEDVAASGGYWLALAGDEIFVTEGSILGSIGVISAGFGFTGLLEKLGMERRVHTAGEHKALLDPFRPERPEDVTRLKALQQGLHETFKAAVRKRRGDKLSAPEESVFEGDVWLGQAAVDLGLADGVGEMRAILRERYGKDVSLVPVKAPDGLSLRRLLRSQGESLAGGLLAQAEDRALWAKYGL